MATKSIRWTLLALALALGAWLFYEKVYLPKSTYDTIKPRRGDLNLTVFGIATVDAKERYPVGSNTGGKLLEVLKDQGEQVRKGELLARLDPVDMPQQLQEAKARKSSARYSLEATQKQIESLKAQLKLAQINYERYAKLSKKGYAAQAEYDKARTDLESLKAQIAANQAQMRSQEAQIRQSEHNIQALSARLSRLEIRSPIDGYVISRDAQPSQTIAPQQSILTLVRPESVWVRTTIDERISGDVRVGQPAAIRLRSRAEDPLPGRVARIEAKSDPVTEERIVDVAFRKVPEPFYLYEQAEVTITTGRLRDVILIPSRLIRKGGVWVYEGGEARFKPLKILARQGDLSAVEGIDETARILIPDSRKKPLFEGADIRLGSAEKMK